MRASPSLSQLWQPHSRLCQLCRVCEQQRSCSPGFCRKELHATESAVEVRRARRRLEDTVTDERVGVFTPDKDGHTHTSCGRVAVIAARRGTVCGEVGRVLRFPSTHGPSPVRRDMRADRSPLSCGPAVPGMAQIEKEKSVASDSQPSSRSSPEQLCARRPARAT